MESLRNTKYEIWNMSFPPKFGIDIFEKHVLEHIQGFLVSKVVPGFIKLNIEFSVPRGNGPVLSDGLQGGTGLLLSMKPTKDAVNKIHTEDCTPGLYRCYVRTDTRICPLVTDNPYHQTSNPL